MREKEDEGRNRQQVVVQAALGTAGRRGRREAVVWANGFGLGLSVCVPYFSAISATFLRFPNISKEL
jgi:hypothetical protein